MMRRRCGICGQVALPYGTSPEGHDFAKHALMERMEAAPGVIEPLSPLAKDLEAAKEAEKVKR